MDKEAFKQQQDLIKLYAAQGSTIWDIYHLNDKKVLEEKIEYYFPNNSVTVKEIVAGHTDLKEIKSAINDYEQIQEEKKAHVRKAVIEAIWKQSKYCGGNILMTTIFVLHTPTIVEPYSSAKHTRNYTCHPLFKVRKCHKNGTSDDCCSIFIDSLGRVYQNWEDYTLNNKLPVGIIIAPKRGVYNFDGNGEVILEYLLTPSSSTGEQLLKVADYSAAALGLGTAIMLPVAAFAAPLAAVAAPITIGCTVIGGLVGSWSIGRSSSDLVDRSKHEQSISLSDSEARSSWLNIATGAVGLGASGISKGAAVYAGTRKTVPRAVQRAVIGANGLALVTNGVGIGNNIFNMIMKYRHNESIKSMDVLELSTSLMLFTHSVYNLHLATKMMNSSNNNLDLVGYISAETTCNVQDFLIYAGKMVANKKSDIIRTLTKIPNHKLSGEVLNKMKQPELPQKIHEDISGTVCTMTSNNKMKQPELPQKTHEDISGTVCTMTSNTSPKLQLVIDLMHTLKDIYFIRSVSSLADVLLHIVDKVTENVLSEIIRLAKNHAKEVMASLQEKFYMLPFEGFLWDLFTVLERLCGVNRKVTMQFIRSRYKVIFVVLKEVYRRLFLNPGEEQKCGTCGGYYMITPNI